MSESITLRSHLTGSLNDLVESAALGPLARCSLICELVCLFADYEEEGAALFLDVFLTNNLKSLIAPIPQSTCLKLGTATCDESGIRKAVKRSAPLVRGCWKMFLSVEDGILHFGLFRDSGHPLNVPLDVALNPSAAGDAKFIRITKINRDTVRTATHAGKTSFVCFTNSKEPALESHTKVKQLSTLICSALEPRLAQTCTTYVESLLLNGLRTSHGSLIAVVKSEKVPAFLSDCTSIYPHLSIGDAVELVRKDATAIPQLSAIESVIFGMFGCDGILIFDTHARVVAYNAFIKVKASNIVGGARRRAYEALSGKVGKGVIGAFFQSQDGNSELRS